MADNNLRIFYQNSRGLRTKCVEFRQSLLLNDYDIVVITESWLHAGILDGEVSDSRYDVFRYDRDLPAAMKETGGGVLALVHRRLNASRVDISCSGYMEILVVTISAKTLKSGKNLHIMCSYIPPDSDRIPDSVDNVINMTKSLYDRHPRDNFLIVGDFNLPCVQWDSNGPTHIKNGPTEIQSAGVRLACELSFLGLVQHNVLKNKFNNTLDLVFSNHSSINHHSRYMHGYFAFYKTGSSSPCFHNKLN